MTRKQGCLSENPCRTRKVLLPCGTDMPTTDTTGKPLHVMHPEKWTRVYTEP